MMLPYARLVALFRLFQQAIRRNLRSVPAIISFLRRAFHFLWERKGELNRHGRAPNAPNIDPEGDGGQPIIFAASLDPLPAMNALSQDYATSNDFSLESVAHPSLNPNPEDVPAPGEGEGALTRDHNTGSASLNVEESSTSVAPPLKLTPEGPPTMPEASNRDRVGASTLPQLSVEYPAFRPIVPTDIKRQNNRHARATYEVPKGNTISPYLPGLIETQGSDPISTDLALDLGEGPGDLKNYCGYYIRTGGTVYWFDEFKAANLEIWKAVPGVTPTDAHIGMPHNSQDGKLKLKSKLLLITTRAGTRVPVLVRTKTLLMMSGGPCPNVLIHISDMTIHALYDVSMSEDSTGTAESAVDQLRSMLQAISAAESQVGKFAAGSVFVLYHSMYIRFRHKLMTSLFRAQEASGSSSDAIHSYTFNLISPMLFYTPEFHLRILRGMYGDTLVYTSVAKETLQKLNEEWQDFIINAAVLLNANIALLAIQSVDDSGTSTSRSPIQIFSYISMAMSTGTIILGLLLVRQTRTKTPKRIAAAMLAHSIHTRAILYSLPYAFLMWAILTFGGAFTSLCFIATNATTRAILAVICAVIPTLTMWCVVYNWEEGRGATKQDATEPRPNWFPRRWWTMFETKRAPAENFELPVTQLKVVGVSDAM
ncbi:hypothetical protein EYR40_004621 [Pleurotus pulmonarius]|nr:hypothetical protein EYR40_004621 [Pleurotus pulmonarius]